ncbi:hypothetical protein DFH09DRAFT_1369113 [Mycena vulgaris]|nr:hypothetical protein DFH09DRAFT_1369113 [Mycena vulgaris]
MRRIFRARQVSIYPTLGLVYYLLASLHRAVSPTLSLGSHRRGTSSVLHERRSATCGWFPSYSGITRTDGAAEHRPSMSDTVFPSSTVLRHHHALHHRALGTRSRKIVPRTADFVAVAQFSHLLDVRLAILLLSAVGVAIAMVHRPASCSRVGPSPLVPILPHSSTRHAEHLQHLPRLKRLPFSYTPGF